MKLFIIFIASLVVSCANADQNETSTLSNLNTTEVDSTTTQENSTKEGTSARPCFISIELGPTSTEQSSVTEETSTRPCIILTKVEPTTTQLSSTTEAICGQDEVHSMCKCPLADLCWTRILSNLCLRCKPGCRCREGYKRRRRDSPCRPMSECRIFGK